MNTISCVIVSYNNEPYISQAITSVLDQTLRADEIIVADDGSGDGTRAIIEALARQHPVIRPVFREQNLGVAANRDLAIRSAGGELITTLDGDDWFYKDKLASESVALSLSRSAVAYSDMVEVNKDATVKREISLLPFAKLSPSRRSLAIPRHSCALPRDILMSRQTYLETGGLRHEFRLYEDWDFLIRLGLCEPNWAYSETRGTAYRRAGEGLSSAPRIQHARARIKVIKENRAPLTTSLGNRYYLDCLARAVVAGGISIADGMLCSLKEKLADHG